MQPRRKIEIEIESYTIVGGIPYLGLDNVPYFFFGRPYHLPGIMFVVYTYKCCDPGSFRCAP